MKDPMKRQAVDARRYTFGNDEFSLETAYHDCKLVFDGITDDDSFQEADTGLILYYANEIIYALQEALQGKDTNVPTNDTISRQSAIDALWKIKDERDSVYYTSAIHTAIDVVKQLPSAQPEIVRCKDCRHLGIQKVFDGYYICPFTERNVRLDDFCSFAERREDEVDS